METKKFIEKRLESLQGANTPDDIQELLELHGRVGFYKFLLSKSNLPEDLYVSSIYSICEGIRKEMTMIELLIEEKVNEEKILEND